MEICPKNTLGLISKLENLGFLDSHFQLIHHWGRIKGKDSSLKAHKKYLEEAKSNYQKNGNNYKVAIKLGNCLELASAANGRPKFFKICKSVDSSLIQQKPEINDFILETKNASLTNNSFLDDTLLLKFIDSFLGYGNHQSDIWFVGMEEGGGGSLIELQTRLKVWNQHQQPELEDLYSFHKDIKIDEYFRPNPKIQRTWAQLIRILLSYNGAHTEVDDCKSYQRNKLARYSSDHCLLELFPLPSPSTSHWLYGEYSTIKSLKTRETYRDSYAENRIRHLKKRIKEYQPKIVIFYGSSYKEYWERVVNSNFSFSNKHSFYYVEKEQTHYLIIKHPTARKVTNDYFVSIGNTLRNS